MRVREDDLVPRGQEPREEQQHRRRRARRHQHLVGRHGDAIGLLVVLGDRLAEGQDAEAVGVLRPTVADGSDGGLAHYLRCLEVGLAELEVHHLVSLTLELLRPLEHLDRQERSDLVGALGELRERPRQAREPQLGPRQRALDRGGQPGVLRPERRDRAVVLVPDLDAQLGPEDDAFDPDRAHVHGRSLHVEHDTDLEPGRVGEGVSALVESETGDLVSAGGQRDQERDPGGVDRKLVLVAAAVSRDVEHHVWPVEAPGEHLAQDHPVTGRHVERRLPEHRAAGRDDRPQDKGGDPPPARARPPYPEPRHALGFFQIPRSCMSRIWRLITFWRYSPCFIGSRFR